MADILIELIDYVRSNQQTIESIGIWVAASVYIFYGLIVALDSFRRFRYRYAPIMVFIAWLIFSILFLPVYLIVRPEIGNKQRIPDGLQTKAILLGSGLDQCPKCLSVYERFYKYCQNCRHPLTKTCPECSEPAAVYWKHCIKCGSKFTDADAIKNHVLAK